MCCFNVSRIQLVFPQPGGPEINQVVLINQGVIRPLPVQVVRGLVRSTNDLKVGIILILLVPMALVQLWSRLTGIVFATSSVAKGLIQPPANHLGRHWHSCPAEHEVTESVGLRVSTKTKETAKKIKHLIAEWLRQ